MKHVRHHSIICEYEATPYPTNLIISKAHTPSENITIERLDIPDLVACLAELGITSQGGLIEDIARWVQGDGHDAQRIALADGIRSSRPTLDVAVVPVVREQIDTIVLERNAANARCEDLEANMTRMHRVVEAAKLWGRDAATYDRDRPLLDAIAALDVTP